MSLIVADKFYTYTWMRKDGTAYYVGKGTKRRAFLSCEGHRPPKAENIIVQDHASEPDAFEAEIFLIAYYGRKDQGTGCLRNLTDGGDGVSGYRFSEEAKKKNGDVRRGKSLAFTEEDLQRRKQSMVGNKFREGLSPWNKGTPWAEEVKVKMRKPKRTFTSHSPDEKTRNKIRATLKLLYATDAGRTALQQRGVLGAQARWKGTQ
jgi:hypothetical protein